MEFTVAHDWFTGMLTYSGRELRLLQCVDDKVRRPIRKAIFRVKLWNPRRPQERRHQESQAIPQHCISLTAITAVKSCPTLSVPPLRRMHVHTRRLREPTTLRRIECSAFNDHLMGSLTSRLLPLTPVPPTLYVLNASSIAKPHATEQLSAELIGNNVDIGVISETHLKKKHADSCVSVNGYLLFRRDRVGRKCRVNYSSTHSSLPNDHQSSSNKPLCYSLRIGFLQGV